MRQQSYGFRSGGERGNRVSEVSISEMGVETHEGAEGTGKMDLELARQPSANSASATRRANARSEPRCSGQRRTPLQDLANFAE